MKNLGKISAVLAVAASLALSGCDASAQAEPETKPSSSTSAESTATATESVTYEAVAVTPDLTAANPMDQDVEALVKSTPFAPEMHQAYTEPEIVEGTTVALNWIEQMVDIPEIYSKDRNPAEDDKIILSKFIETIKPMYQAEAIEKTSVGGGHVVVPVSDTDGHWMGVTEDSSGERVLDSQTWSFDGAPESIVWSNINVDTRVGVNGEILIGVYAVGSYPVVNVDGSKGIVPVNFRVATVKSDTEPGKWMVNGWHWEASELIPK